MKLIVLTLCLVAMTSASDDVIMEDLIMEDGSGEEAPTSAKVIGQVLLSAKLMASGLDALKTHFEDDHLDELEEQIKKMNANYEMVTDPERKLFEDAIVSLSQAAMGKKLLRNTLASTAGGVLGRANSIRMITRKVLIRPDNLRMQQSGIRLIVTKMNQLLVSEIDSLTDATNAHVSVMKDLMDAYTGLTKFTANVTDMANKEGERYKKIYAEWKDLYFENIFKDKIAKYWSYVLPTLDGLKQFFQQWLNVVGPSEKQFEEVAKVSPTMVASQKALMEAYESYKSSAEFDNPIDVEEFKRSYSLSDLEKLVQSARNLSDL